MNIQDIIILSTDITEREILVEGSSFPVHTDVFKEVKFSYPDADRIKEGLLKIHIKNPAFHFNPEQVRGLIVEYLQTTAKFR